MKLVYTKVPFLLILAFVFVTATGLSRAGNITVWSKPAELEGKLSITATGIQVQGSPATEVKFADILEANFADDFRINYFCSIGDASTQLPPGWAGQDLQKMDAPGSATYAGGELTLHSPQWNAPQGDSRAPCYAFGLPWTGDGQWTYHIKSASAYTGFILADHLPPSAHIGVANWDNNWDYTFLRDARGGTCGDRFPTQTQEAIPVWFRVIRQGNSFSFFSSKDGKAWDLGVQKLLDLPKELQVIFFTNSHIGNVDATAVFDQVVFTPASGGSEAHGVLLRSGSFLAGSFEGLDFNNKEPVGQLRRSGQVFSITPEQIAAVIFHPVTRQQLADASGQPGILMKNNDVITGNFMGINGDIAALDSLIMGIDMYTSDQMSACILHPVKPLRADFEIRLKDGSNILAKSLTQKDKKLTIDEVSGLELPVMVEEIAQIHAGTARVREIGGLNWKAVAPPAIKGAPETSYVPEPVVAWTGENQEQIIAVTSGASVQVPLDGAYRSLIMRVALPPHSPAGTEAKVRVLADGKEIMKAPPVRAGDLPRLTQIDLPPAKIVTIEATGTSPDARILLVDPLLIRENAL